MVQRLSVIVFGVLLLTAIAGHAGAIAAGPAVFWASDPVRPGEAVMAIGEGFVENPPVEVVRLPDGAAAQPVAAAVDWSGAAKAEVLQSSAQSIKFALPADAKPGVFAYRVTTPDGSVVALLNRPRIWWIQGDSGTAASPGGWIALFGVNLAASEPSGGEEGDSPVFASRESGKSPRALGQSFVRLEGPVTVGLAAEADLYAARCPLPADLPPGEYKIFVHSGLGGAAAWSEPVTVTVRVKPAWPQTVFNVKDSGAEGDGVKDDTGAIEAALAKAEKAGGGVVYFPRGRYRVSEGLKVPRMTVLRGEKQSFACLAWSDLAEPPEALVRGTNSFALEELTLYADNHRHVIAGDLGDQPGAGDVRLWRVLVRADLYRGQLKPEDVDRRFRESLRWSTGGGDTVRLGGPNVQIEGCDFYGSGRALFLSRVRGGRLVDNRFHNGRWGWYCISGSSGLIFQGNAITGADLMSTGGGLNCLDGSTYSENVYYAGNTLRMMHGWDREAMTSDAGGECYFGRAAAVKGTSLTLAERPQGPARDWAGAGVFVLAGRGAGQVRRVARMEGTAVEIDRPWTADPDEKSDLCITMFQGRYLLVDNEFTDTGAVQFYGTSIECLVARNRGTRMPGFTALGLWYHGYQPSWFCQFLENQVLEGNYYHWHSAADAVVGVTGARREPYQGPLNRGAVLRRNRLEGQAHLRVTGACSDAVVEGNRVKDSATGVFVSRDASGVLVRNNHFERVDRPVVDEEAVRRAAEERMKRFLGRREPVAAWDFEELQGKRFADSSGNGFWARLEGNVAVAPEGRRGKAARFGGAGWLRVEEPAVFNAPDVTVSFWIMPEKLTGRRGLVAKRFGGTAAPLVISQNGAAVGFEAAEAATGVWTFNFASPAVLSENQWTHVAVAVKGSEGVIIYADGKPVAEKKNAADRAVNAEPLILGREAWGGDPPKGDTPGFFIGLLDEVRIWTRALTREEVQAECAGVRSAP